MQRIKIYFDYVCPYCLIANANVRRLRKEFPQINFEWKPWEIVPEMPPGGIRLEFNHVSRKLAKLAEEAGLWLRAPSLQPNSHMALLSLFYARERDFFQQYQDAVFSALWDNDENIGQVATLAHIMEKIGLDPVEYKRRITVGRDGYERMLAESERDAIKDQIELVPTYMFDERRIVGNISVRRIERFIKRVATLEASSKKGGDAVRQV